MLVGGAAGRRLSASPAKGQPEWFNRVTNQRSGPTLPVLHRCGPDRVPTLQGGVSYMLAPSLAVSVLVRAGALL